MKVLFDESVPRGLRRFLKHSHEVRTAQEEDLTATKNGELLRAAENRGFDVLVTSDKNIAYQQNMRDRKIALVVLPLNDWSQLKPIGPQISAMVDGAAENCYQALELSALMPGRARSRRNRIDLAANKWCGPPCDGRREKCCSSSSRRNHEIKVHDGKLARERRKLPGSSSDIWMMRDRCSGGAAQSRRTVAGSVLSA